MYIFIFSNTHTECPEIVRKVILNVSDITGNTTSTSSGTVVQLHCLGDYHLVGFDVLRCVDGEWDLPVPSCIMEGRKDSHGNRVKIANACNIM